MLKFALNWSNVRWIYLRELRDQLRDRRTLFTILVLPVLLYPLLGMSFLQITQFTREHPASVALVGVEALPQVPKLLRDDGNGFAEELATSTSARLKLETVPLTESERGAAESLGRRAEGLIRSGKYDVVVFFPADFGERLEQFRNLLRTRSDAEPMTADPAVLVPQPELFVDTASDKSRVAHDRVERILNRWRQLIVEENLRQSHVPPAATTPFQLTEHDIAKEPSRRAAVWSKILPFVVLIWALTGAFYPAIDLCAGEKERGTLETLLSSPAERSEIVWGKLLTVMTFSVGTSVFNLLSMGTTGAFIMSQMHRMGVSAGGADLGQPPWFAFAWLAVILVPISGLFSALSLAIATFARSSKEGQYYLMPLLMISLPLMMLPILPGTELDLGTSLIPVTGVMLLLRALIEGQYWDALRFSLPVIGVTGACCLLAIRWAIDQFNNESVLFRESERFGLGIWLRHLVRDRQMTPNAAEALLCGVVLLLVHFFASLSAPVPRSWNHFASLTLINLVALIATPALLMTVMLTRSPRQTLLLQRPSAWSVPAAILLAVCFHPVGMALAAGIQQLYPISGDIAEQLGQISGLMGQAPNIWVVLGLLALTPAICEELAFRGFILSGLRQTGRKWIAILVSSLFFGATHGLMQQSIAAAILGLLIGYIAVQTNSIFPGMAFHAVYNALGLWLSSLAKSQAAHDARWEWLLETGSGGVGYTWAMTAVGAFLACLLLVWLHRLPASKANADEKPSLESNTMRAVANT